MTELTTSFDVAAARARFSSLRSGFLSFDAPGGSQVPDEIGDAMARALREASANLGVPYATGQAAGSIFEGARADAARFLGSTTEEIVFGANMTTLNFALSRAAGRGFAAGDSYERELAARFLAGLPDTVRLYGVPRLDGRVPTFLVTVEGLDAETAAGRLVERGIGVWAAGNWYCVGLADRLPPASIRIGLIHYDTAGEVDRLLDELAVLG